MHNTTTGVLLASQTSEVNCLFIICFIFKLALSAASLIICKQCSLVHRPRITEVEQV